MHILYVSLVLSYMIKQCQAQIATKKMRKLLTGDHSVVTLVRLEGNLFNRLELVFS